MHGFLGLYMDNCQISGNTVKSNGVVNDSRIYGRQGNEKGVLYIDGQQVSFK